MFPYAISNSLEQVVRLTLIVLFLPKFVSHGTIYGVCAFILLSIISEISSIIIFLFFLPKNAIITTKDLKPSKKIMGDVLSISLPTVSSRLIGNIGFFFEPIILTNILLFIGYSNEFILEEYGAFNAYSLALLTMPNFFIGAISNSLVPEISKFHSEKNYKMVKRRFNQALLFSFILGVSFTIPIFIFRNKLLLILYNTTKGADYIKVLSPFFVLFYLETPIICTLQGLGLASYTMKITTIGIILKNIVLALFSFLRIGIYGLIISEIVNIIFVVLTNITKIRKEFKRLS
jgi:stage V sporulation protein B